MKRLIAAAFLIALAPSAAAIANYSGPTGNGTVHILSGSSAGASTGVTEGENGSTVRWRAEVAGTGASCTDGNATGVRDVNWTTGAGPGGDAADRWRTVTFAGTVRTPTPCHALDHDVLDRGNGTFVLDVTSHPLNRTCVQCIGAVTYRASFGAPGDYRLTVMHDGRLVEVLDSPRYGEEPGTDTGFLAAVIDILAGLFGF